MKAEAFNQGRIIINMKPKFKFKINFFDVLIIVLALVAGFVVLRLSNADGGGATMLSTGTPVKVRYTVELSNLPEGIAELIKPGDSLSEAVEKRFIGNVVSVEIGPYMTTSKNSYTGDFILTSSPGRYTATVTVELDAVDTGSSIDASGFLLRANSTPSVLGPGYAGPGLITAIER